MALILIRSLIGYAPPVGMVWQLERTLGVGTALDFFTAANVFVEMVSAPQRVKPWLPHVARGGAFVIMASGVAGTVMEL